MKNEPFVIERTFNAPVERVWKAITDKDQMKQWYFDLNSFRLELGFEFSFTGKGSAGEDYVHLCKITEIQAGRKLAYSWQYKDYPGYSVVTFELFPEPEGQTRLRLTHEGLETFPGDSKDFKRESFMMGWTELIGKNLKEFVND